MWWLFGLWVLDLTSVVSALDCHVEPDGVYEKGCKSFIKCVHGELVAVECHENLVFNSVIQDCDDPSNVKAPCGHIMDCEHKADGHYPDLDQKCQTYYSCYGGVFFGHNFCPGGLVYNVENGICDWPFNVPFPCGTLIPTLPPTTDTPTPTTTTSSSTTTTPTTPTTIIIYSFPSNPTLPQKTMSFVHATVNKQN